MKVSVRAEPGCLLGGKLDVSLVPVVDRRHQGYNECGERGSDRESNHGPRIRTPASSHSIEGLDWSYPLKR